MSVWARALWMAPFSIAQAWLPVMLGLTTFREWVLVIGTLYVVHWLAYCEGLSDTTQWGAP